MSIPIIVTKLYAPPVGPQLVPRLRLVEQLNQVTQRKFTLISAPAGFGKTTLISHWLRQNDKSNKDADHPLQTAWYSLDESDNDSLRFMAYVVAALQQINPTIGQSVQTELEASQPPPLNQLVASLINEIATANTNIIFVLDDYHVIQNQSIHATLSFLLNYSPPQLHVIMTSRADPPLPLARLRARGQMIEIRADDLRFRPDEAAAFLHHASGLNLSAENVAALENRTEGWIAGLQLAALSIRGQNMAQADDFILAFTGDDRYIVDYLVEEVLHRQPEDIQIFLLQTAILEFMISPLCNAVTGRSDSQAVLEMLEQANLFIVPLDNKRQWYRYHHLFVDLLRNRLHQTRPDVVPELHLKASRWCEQNGGIDHAIAHALAAHDFERVTALIESHAETAIWGQGNIQTVLNWLDALPEEVVSASPRLCLTKAWALFELFPHQTPAIEPLLQQAVSLLKDAQAADSTDPAQTMLGEVYLVRANLARRNGDMPVAIKLCRQALGHLPDGISLVRGGIALTLASAYDFLGDMIKATPTYQEGIDICRKTENMYAAIINIAKLIDSLVVQGKLRQAGQTFKQTLPMLEHRHSSDVGMLYINAGNLFRELNDFEAAVTYLEQGIDLCRPFAAMSLMVVAGYISLARINQAQGSPDEALAMLQKAETFSQVDTMLYPSVRFGAVQARLWLAQGHLTSARRWADTNQLTINDELTYAYEIDYLTLARLLIAQNKGTDALHLLDRLHQNAVAGGRTGRVIEIQMLRALAHQSLGGSSQALSALEQSLSAAQPEGYLRLFADEGLPLKSLLQTAQDKNGRLKPYISTLLTAFGEKAIIQPAALRQAQDRPFNLQPLIEPLTKRELKTLHLLATDLSVPEIADELVVAVSTVRSHTKSIYGKLGVHSRHEAVHRAKALKLL